LRFSGRVSGGVIKLQAAGASMSGKVSSSGTFAASGRLRKHRLGTKMQWWKGKISGRTISLRATFGVSGHKQTYCTARGTARLR
jgi:hypothetical protein